MTERDTPPVTEKHDYLPAEPGGPCTLCDGPKIDGRHRMALIGVGGVLPAGVMTVLGDDSPPLIIPGGAAAGAGPGQPDWTGVIVQEGLEAGDRRFPKTVSIRTENGTVVGTAELSLDDETGDIVVKGELTENARWLLEQPGAVSMEGDETWQTWRRQFQGEFPEDDYLPHTFWPASAVVCRTCPYPRGHAIHAVVETSTPGTGSRVVRGVPFDQDKVRITPLDDAGAPIPGASRTFGAFVDEGVRVDAAGHVEGYIAGPPDDEMTARISPGTGEPMVEVDELDGLEVDVEVLDPAAALAAAARPEAPALDDLIDVSPADLLAVAPDPVDDGELLADPDLALAAFPWPPADTPRCFGGCDPENHDDTGRCFQCGHTNPLT